MGERETEVTLPRSEHAPQRARRQLAELCHDCSRDVLDTAQLLVSEVVTNALRHTEGGIRMRAVLTAEQLQVEIGDAAVNQPEVGRPGPADEGGRGLQILDALATEWGIGVRPSWTWARKSVWFRIRTDAKH